MFKFGKCLLMVFLWSVISNTQSLAATRSVDCSSSTTVQTAVNDASSGDTVICSTSGSYTWSSPVSIPSTKSITLSGNGATIAGGSSGVLVIPSSASYTARVTNFTFTTDNAINTSGDAITNTPWRMDHCTFNGSGTSSGAMITTFQGPGLIDHCTFINLPWAKETIHNAGWGAGNTGGWTNIATPGSRQALYFEDNTVTVASGSNYANVAQNYYGARIVARFNTFNNVQIDVHGNATGPSGRWWEFYDNTLNGPGSLFCLRGGSGIIWGNIGDSNGDNGAIFVDDGNAPYYGIGYGQNDVENTPAYAVDNGTIPYYINQAGCSVFVAGAVIAGTDIITPSTSPTVTYGTLANMPSTCTVNQGYLATDQGSWNQSKSGGQGVLYKCTATNTWTLYYTPYTYPHPLIAGGSTPSAPTQLQISEGGP